MKVFINTQTSKAYQAPILYPVVNLSLVEGEGHRVTLLQLSLLYG